MPFVQLPSNGNEFAGALSWRVAPANCQSRSGDAVFLETCRPGDMAWLVVIVDVEGHGSTAANVIDLLRIGFFDDGAWNGLEPADLLSSMNGYIAGTGNIQENAEAVALRIDPGSRGVRAAIAGVLQPRVRTAGRWCAWGVMPTGALGWPTCTPTQEERLLQPGEQLLACSDGVYEWVTGVVSMNLALVEPFLNGLPPAGDSTQLVELVFLALQQAKPVGFPGDDTTAVGWQA